MENQELKCPICKKEDSLFRVDPTLTYTSLTSEIVFTELAEYDLKEYLYCNNCRSECSHENGFFEGYHAFEKQFTEESINQFIKIFEKVCP